MADEERTARLPEEPRSAAPVGVGRAAPSLHGIWVDLLLYPTHSLPTAAAPVLVGLGLGAHGRVLAALPALVGFVGSWFIHVAGVFADNHELLRRHPDLPEHPELSHAIALGTLKLSSLRWAIAGCLLVALATVPYLYRLGGTPVLAFGAVGIASSLCYHGWPFAYVRRGLADPVFFLMFGVVAVAGTYYIQAASFAAPADPWRLLLSLSPAAFVVGLPAGALVTSVMLIDDLRDRDFDSAKGWRTPTVRFGASFTRAEIGILVCFAYLAPVLFWLALPFDAWVLLPLASAPLALATVKAVRSARRREELVPLTPRMARLAVIHSALLGLGLGLSR
ncbi:MAG TPA: prenyltransferase [Anaeromyxobacteraceae bacterium]|nr:prenyltransferase [Anaeromyxobacteraceae bacterium]